MPTLNTILLVAVSGVLFSASPGPSMLYVLSRAIGQGRTAGYASAIGLALGGAALAIITAVSFGWLFAGRPDLFRVIKIVGGLYLLWLGARILLEAREARLGELDQITTLPFSTILRQGFFVELLNPKTVLFFLSFLPGFVDTSGSSFTTQLLVLGMLIPLTAIPTDLAVATGGAWLADRLREKMQIGFVLEFVGGIVVVGLGIRTLLTL